MFGLEATARRSKYFRRENKGVEARVSYFGGGPLFLEYEEYSDISDRSNASGFQFVGGAMWDYLGLEVRFVPETINQYSFQFDGENENIDYELSHRLYVLAKPYLPIGGIEDPAGWIYGLAGPSFGDVRTTKESNTTTMEAGETDLVYGLGAAVPVDELIFQVDWLENMNRSDYVFSGVYFGIHYRFGEERLGD
ncbi:MAG: hypothetical protein ACQEP7_03545 [bacterium]